MPCIHIIGAIKILMYFDDHAPPHVHAMYNEYEALIGIHDPQVLRGELPVKQLKAVLAWATEHQAFLEKKWNEFNPAN